MRYLFFPAGTALLFLVGCATTVFYGSPRKPDQVIAEPNTAIAYLLPRAYDARPIDEAFNFTNLSWFLAYVSAHDSLPARPEYSLIAATTLRRGYTCSDYERPSHRQQILVSPEHIISDTFDLATSNGAPQVLRPDCKWGRDYVPQMTVESTGLPLPKLSLAQWVRAAELSGLTCAVKNEAANCLVQSASMRTSYNSAGVSYKNSKDGIGRYTVEIASAQITLRTNQHPDIVYLSHEIEIFAGTERELAFSTFADYKQALARFR